MQSLLSGIAGTVRRAPGVVVATIVALTIVFGWLAGQAAPPAEDGFESFSTDSPAALTQARVDELFPPVAGPEVAQLVLTEADGDVLDASGVQRAAALRADLLADPAVAAALAPADAGAGASPIVTFADLVVGTAAAQGLDLAVLDDATVDQVQAAALTASPGAVGIVGLLGTPTAEATAAEAGMVLVMLDGTADEAVLDAARAAINARAGSFDDHDVFTFDFEALNAASQETLTAEMGKLLGLAFLLIIAILAAVYRRPGDVMASLFGLFFAVIWSQGITVLLGPDFLGLIAAGNQMAMAIPILLVGLGVDYGIHLTMRTREEVSAGASAEQGSSRAVMTVGSALVLATITTVVGFLTNLSNPLPPLQDFGIIAAFGVFAAFVVMVTFVPATRLLLARRRGATDVPAVPVEGARTDGPGLLGRLAAGIAPIAVARPWAVVATAGVLAVAAGLSATNLSTEFSQTDFFPEGSRALETVELVMEQFGGGLDETTTVLVEPAVDEAVLTDYVAGLGAIEEVRSFQGGVQVQPQVAPDGSAVVLRVATSAGEDAAPLVDALDALAEDVLAPAGATASLTSEAILTREILDDLAASQVQGLVITLAASMLILALAFGLRVRAPMLGVMAIVAVGVVTVWVLGLMALVGIPFNVMTAMVSSLAIGIGVPFGIHVVNRFLEDRATHPDTLDAMRTTLQNTGGALVGSALTTVAGFGVLVFATIPPMQQFGLVTAVTIALALVSSLVVLPALLALWARRAAPGAVDLSSDAGVDESVREPVPVG